VAARGALYSVRGNAPPSATREDGLQGGGPGPGNGGSSPMMAAYLDHTILSSPEVESRAALRLAGQIFVSHKVASGGNPRSLDQSIMVFVSQFLREGIG
jgi:hypothetical protein